MTKKLILLSLLCVCFAGAVRGAGAPLRVFIRAGEKTHGPGAHDHPAFLRDWVPLLNARGAKADGSLEFPTAAQLDNTDVLIIEPDGGGKMNPDERALLQKFIARGGGIVVIHAGIVSNDAAWYKPIIGGSWAKETKWFEGPMSLYFTDRDNPITKDCSNFDMDDEIYYDLDLSPDIRVLAAAYTPKPVGRSPKADERAQKFTEGGKRVSVYDIQPQMWMYEKDGHRAFVSIPGHLHVNFARPNYRAILLRGIAWAGKRENTDEFCTKEELASLRYPEGGPSLPEKTLAQTVVHPEFKMSLVAAEPLINKAMNVDWDPQGRMWVVETPEYPNGRRLPKTDPWKDSGSLVKTGDIANRPATDRISILTDPDGHGVFQKKHVFYEGLELATSMVFHKDGVIVSQAPDILWLRDTKGTGKADTVVKLYTGLGTMDTHAVINNLRWGMDGWVYATLGYSAGNPVSATSGKKFGHMDAGVVRFKPDGSAFEQVSSKASNTWGLDISWDNEIFFTQPTCGEVFMHVVMPESVLARGRIGSTTSWKANVVGQKTYPLMSYTQQAYVQIDQVGFFTAAAGCAIYDGGTWPKKWNGSYFTTEPTINIVHHEFVTPNGVTFDAHKEKGREETEFAQGKDYWWRPIEVRVGPDGALYVVDFYNQAVIHNDTRGPQHGPGNAAVRPDRDHYFGRIWRVDHKDAKTIAVPDLSRANNEELANALEHPNRHVRMTASRLLAEKFPDARQENENLALGAVKILRGFLTEASSETKVLALWTLYRMGAITPENLSSAFADKDSAVRKNAAEIAALQPASAKMAGVAKLLDDPDARVRLEAALAFDGMDLNKDTIRQLVSMFSKAGDDWTKSAIAGLATKAPVLFLDAALAAVDPVPLQPLVRHIGTILTNAKDGTAIAKAVIALVSKPTSANPLKQALLSTLGTGVAPVWSSELQGALGKLLASTNTGVAAATLPLVAAWDKDHALTAAAKPVVKSLLEKLDDATAIIKQREQIAIGLIGARELDAQLLPAVMKLVGSKASPILQARIISALGDTGDAAVGAQFVTLFMTVTEPPVRDAVLNQLIKHTDWSLALVDALKSGKVTLADLGPVAAGRLRTHADRKVSAAATAVIDAIRGPQLKVKDDLIAKFMPTVSQPGNLVNGKMVFEQNCLVCHAYQGAGKTQFAPDLTGMGSHGAANLIVAILDPNREVDPSFLTVDVQQKNGDAFNGIIVRENANTVLLRNAGGDAEIKKSDIASRRNTGLSLMPEGFEALGPESIRDIIAYLMAGTVVANGNASAQTVSSAKQNLPAGGKPEAMPTPLKWGAGTKVLLLGGGSSHDFDKWFNQADVATLTAWNPKLSIHYTDNVDVAARELANVDVLVSSTNQAPLAKPEMQKALFDFASAGKGIVFLHPGVWYNWKTWPEYNLQLIGGGSHSHDAIAEFEVKITNTVHPVTAGLPAGFKITDELYRVAPDPQGTPVEVLATATSPSTGKTFPSIWIVKHPKARIVCIAPGHDERTHDLPEYKKLLENAVGWVMGK